VTIGALSRPSWFACKTGTQAGWRIQNEGRKETGAEFHPFTGYQIIPYPTNGYARSRDTMRMVLDGLSIDCVIDVGGNHGQFGDCFAT